MACLLYHSKIFPGNRLNPDVAVFVQKVAAQKGVDVATLVNDWLRKDMAFFETVMP